MPDNLLRQPNFAAPVALTGLLLGQLPPKVVATNARCNTRS